ncbi:MAG: phosphate/phosphite/phosphonate ABC transporter substrate-binding protein, partial [Dongiaceae bacterium]
MVVAELPMYDLPDLRSSTDAWWAGIARALRRAGIEEVPDQLTRDRSAEGQHDLLLLSQVCGSNMVGEGRNRLTYVATPCYTAPGCNGPLYRSVIVVPATCPARTIEDLRGSRCAINGYRSHSGCNALRATFAPLAQGGRFFSSVTVSGGHALSLALMASGQVDVAAIDCITYALLVRCRPHVLEDTRMIAQTVAAPVGPYVTRIGASADLIARMRSGLAQAMDDPDLATARADLLLRGIEILSVDDYAPIARIEVDATRLGYRDFDQET